jgi:chromosome segregation ATPase
LQQRCKEAEASLAEVEEQRRHSEAQLQALGHKVTQAQQAHDEGKRQAAESKQAAEAERTRLDEVCPYSAALRPILLHPTDDDIRHAAMESL